jgi:PhnB protein
MPKAKHHTPEGYHSATAALVVDDAAKALEFYVKGLGAKERMRSAGPGGKVWHAEIEIGDSVVKGTTSGVWLYVPDVDAAFQRAVSAGAEAKQEPQTMFWGDRFASIVDPWGHSWSMATHVEDVPPEEMEKRAQEAMRAMSRPTQS